MTGKDIFIDMHINKSIYTVLIDPTKFKCFKFGLLLLFRYFFTHDSTNDHTHPFSTTDFDIIKKRTLRDVLCDNMQESMPMVARNPFLTFSEENPLENCNPISNMRARDLSFFDGEEPSGIPKSIPPKEGIFI